MALIILMCFMTLLHHSVLGEEFADVKDDNKNGDSDKNSNSEEADSGSSQHFSNTTKGFLPPLDHEFISTRHKKVIKVRSVGKVVDLPADVVKQMKNTPLSALAGHLPENQKSILETHNKFRSEVSPSATNMLRLIWDEKAQQTALAYAKKCKEEHSPISERTIQDPYMTCGENLFLAPFKMPWSFVITFWYNECHDFIYGKGPRSFSDVIGHYLQLIWGSSHKIGCDLWECDNLVNRYLYVCHYCPAGNRGAKEFPYKKGPPCSDCPNSCEGKLCTNACPVENKYRDCDSYNTNNACTTDQSLVSDCPATCKCTKGEIR